MNLFFWALDRFQLLQDKKIQKGKAPDQALVKKTLIEMVRNDFQALALQLEGLTALHALH
jgi:hypothetical protein